LGFSPPCVDAPAAMNNPGPVTRSTGDARDALRATGTQGLRAPATRSAGFRVRPVNAGRCGMDEEKGDSTGSLHRPASGQEGLERLQRHSRSRSRPDPFVAVKCAALPASRLVEDSPNVLLALGSLGYTGSLEGREHQLLVDGWVERVRAGSAEALIRAFERLFAALWDRSHLTLGEVTLTAITERVLHTATERYPMLASIEVTTSGLRCDGLRTQQGLPLAEVTEGIRFVLVEFLTVLGNLTAQILTPALRSELSIERAVEDPAP